MTRFSWDSKRLTVIYEIRLNHIYSSPHQFYQHCGSRDYGIGYIRIDLLSKWTVLILNCTVPMGPFKNYITFYIIPYRYVKSPLFVIEVHFLNGHPCQIFSIISRGLHHSFFIDLSSIDWTIRVLHWCHLNVCSGQTVMFANNFTYLVTRCNASIYLHFIIISIITGAYYFFKQG